MEIDTYHFKDLLQAEQSALESELETVGRKNPENPNDWEPVEPEADRDRADETEVADGIAEFEDNTGILNQLEVRLTEVKKALDRIEAGTYGICEVCEAPIEMDRLEANPAASTCKLHKEINTL